MINLAVLVSGRGSNMESILQNIKDGMIMNINPSVVISNKQNAKALEVAKQYRVDAVFIDDQCRKGANWDYDQKVIQCLHDHDVRSENGLICLAGFMRILSREFVTRYRGRIMNIHPALLPAFPGLNAQKQAVEYGVKVSGCTVHFIDDGVDTGPIIIQAIVEVKEDDTLETLAERILKQEHRIYPEAVRLFAEGKLSIEGRKVRVRA